MKRLLLSITVLVIVIIALGVYWMGTPKGPSLDDVAHLREPHILDLPSQKVFEFTAVGDPTEMAGTGFGAVMGAYFSLKGVPKFGPDMPAPRARWPLDVTTPRNEWIGVYAMPVPDSVATAPEGVRLASWENGEMAEILHVGRYLDEPPTVARLMEFVGSEGYEISGAHEEIYLRGPGMLFEGNPDTYLTLIRYPVARPDSSMVESP